MKLLCDEGVDRPIVDALRGAGHDVSYVAEMSPGIPYRQGRAHHGVLLVRLHGLEAPDKARMVVGAVAERGDELPGAFAVIDRNRIRVRRRPS